LTTFVADPHGPATFGQAALALFGEPSFFHCLYAIVKQPPQRAGPSDRTSTNTPSELSSRPLGANRQLYHRPVLPATPFIRFLLVFFKGKASARTFRRNTRQTQGLYQAAGPCQQPLRVVRIKGRQARPPNVPRARRPGDAENAVGGRRTC
jgi:hypothetical protein